jgi:glycerol kinase
LTLLTPSSGWVEQSPDDLLKNFSISCISTVLKEFKDKVSCIGITNQRETTIAWNKSTGKPYAIVWMDTRTSAVDHLISLTSSPIKDEFVDICGLPLSTYFFLLKIWWMLENIPTIKMQ